MKSPVIGIALFVVALLLPVVAWATLREVVFKTKGKLGFPDYIIITVALGVLKERFFRKKE